MRDLPKAYKVCKVKINKKQLKIPKIKAKEKDSIIVNSSEIIDVIKTTEKLNLKSHTKISYLDSKISNSDIEYSNNISLTIEPDKETNIVYNEHFITISLCYNFRVTNNPIDDLEKTHLIGTNILTYMGDKVPVFKINDIDNIKYKRLVREKCKELWNVKNKYISAIKHINNYKNFHNYLVLLDNSCKSTVKFIKKFKNQMNTCEKDYCWRTFFGMYSPNNFNPSKREVYENIAKITLPSLNLSLKDFENNKLQIKNIYKSLSFCIGDEVY